MGVINDPFVIVKIEASLQNITALVWVDKPVFWQKIIGMCIYSVVKSLNLHEVIHPSIALSNQKHVLKYVNYTSIHMTFRNYTRYIVCI